MNTLEVNNIVKSYKSRKVVDRVSFKLNAGESVGLLGPNGAGKTTSFYMIAGLIRPDKGRIFLNNIDITHAPIHKRAKQGLGYLPQEPSVFQKLSVEKNIAAVLELKKGLTRQEKHRKLEALIEEFNLNHVRNIPGISLSGGERKRVEIARTLAIDPKFVLFDEPFAGVDPISVANIKDSITHLCKRKIGVLMTDHNVRETLDICQTAYILHQGEVIAQGTPENIFKSSQVRQVYLGNEFTLSH
jgi:lipopolysaccharide export system ATP-binding protein